ncbi:MAG: endonuclease [Muribaculaceae bacterium]|nr:endonuclease [Muribaculaceae bacterium]
MNISIRIPLAWVIFFAGCLSLSAEIPAGYYSSVSGKRDGELKTALHNLLYNHTLISSYSNLPNYFRKTDVYPPGDPRYGQWWDMYSNIPLYTYSFSGLNREHSFPKSWWGGSTDTPAYVDLNHLYPSEAAANMAKSNYPLGEVTGKPAFENGITTVGAPVPGQGGGARQVFEPADEYKGDFARTYFYMVTCYQNLTWRYTWMVSNNLYPTLNTWAVELLLKWHKEDPVSQKELDRNEEVYKVQANRNPFIDYPELADYLWGDKRGTPFIPAGQTQGDPVLITPVQDMALEFGETVINTSNTASLQIRGENIRTNPELTLSGTDRAMFSLEVSSVTATNVNKPEGTWVRVTYKPTSLGEHTARLIVSSYDGAKSRGISLRGTALEKPLLSDIRALPATDITATSYTAMWEQPANDVIDYYVITRTIYPDNSETYWEEQVAEEPHYTFTDCEPGTRESYNVRSCRLGFYSAPSNEIYVTLPAGIDNIAADAAVPMGWRLADGVILTLPAGAIIRDVTIYDLQGRLITILSEVSDGYHLPLAPGAYIITAPGLTTPLRLIY